MLSLMTAIIGVAMLAGFTGFMLWWVPAPPLITIVVVVMCLLLYDVVQTLRYGESSPRR
jgi:hypothetical protein